MQYKQTGDENNQDHQPSAIVVMYHKFSELTLKKTAWLLVRIIILNLRLEGL